MVAPVHGEWLRDNPAGARLGILCGEGRLLPMRHWAEILPALVRS